MVRDDRAPEVVPAAPEREPELPPATAGQPVGTAPPRGLPASTGAPVITRAPVLLVPGVATASYDRPAPAAPQGPASPNMGVRRRTR